jgi:hypothetical protein
VRAFAGMYRWVFGLLGAVTVAWGFRDSVLDGGFSWVSYFSFFTILSNISAIAVFLLGAWPRTSVRDPWLFGFVRGAVTVYMTITFVVSEVLLRGVEGGGPQWILDIEHRVMPAAVLLDWLLMPPARRIGVRRAMAWLIIPVVYLVYSEVRGAVVHFYPYPFLDPRPHGVLHVLVSCLGVAAGFVVVAIAVAVVGDAISRRRERRAAAPAPA